MDRRPPGPAAAGSESPAPQDGGSQGDGGPALSWARGPPQPRQLQPSGGPTPCRSRDLTPGQAPLGPESKRACVDVAATACRGPGLRSLRAGRGHGRSPVIAYARATQTRGPPRGPDCQDGADGARAANTAPPGPGSSAQHQEAAGRTRPVGTGSRGGPGALTPTLPLWTQRQVRHWREARAEDTVDKWYARMPEPTGGARPHRRQDRASKQAASLRPAWHPPCVACPWPVTPALCKGRSNQGHGQYPPPPAEVPGGTGAAGPSGRPGWRRLRGTHWRACRPGR